MDVGVEVGVVGLELRDELELREELDELRELPFMSCLRRSSAQIMFNRHSSAQIMFAAQGSRWNGHHQCSTHQ